MALKTFEYAEPPSRRDAGVFSLRISYDPLTESPSRLLRSTASFMDAFANMDASFTLAIDPSIETSLALLAIEDGSIRAWAASILRSLDDEALKDLDLKRIIGAYLVKAKYLTLQWLESEHKSKSIIELQSAILEEAKKTDVLLIPSYNPPSRPLIIEGVRRVQSAKDGLAEADTITFEAGRNKLTLDTSKRTDVSQLEDVEIESRKTHDLHRAALKVKKPDLLGHSQWHLKFKERTVPSSIEDRIWLRRFQSREITLRPGDALICDGTLTQYFDKTGTPISEKVEVTKVHGVEYQSSPQTGFFD